MRTLALAVSTAAFATACTPFPTATGPDEGLVSVRGEVKPRPAAGFGLKAVTRVPYTLDRLEYIDVVLEDLTTNDGPTIAGVLNPIGGGPTGRTFAPLVLRNLRANHDYRVILLAWQADPAAGGSVIPVFDNDAGGCETTFSTIGANPGEAEEYIEVPGGFALKLADQQVDGSVDGTLGLVHGIMADKGLGESVVLP